MNLVSDDTSNGRSSLVHAFAKDVQSPVGLEMKF